MSSVYTSGPIGKVMLRTACSMLAGTLAISGYNIADTFFVAKLGPEQLAAMGYTFPVVMLIGCLCRGLDSGILTPFSQLLGGGKRPRAASMVSAGMILLGALSLTIGLIGSTTIDATFSVFGAGDKVMPHIKAYMVIWYLGCVTGALSMAGNGLLVSAGAAKSAGLLMMGGMLLNVALDPLFIFGLGPLPGMGIAGAALATVLSQIFTLITAIWLLHGRMHLVGSFKIPPVLLFSYWRTIFRYGIPSSLSMLLVPIGAAVVTRAVADVGGDIAVAAAAAGGRLEVVAFIFPMSLGIALMPMVGQNFGAGCYGRIDQCRRFAMRFAGVMLLLMATVYFFAAPYLAVFFTSDAEVFAILCLYLRIIPWGFAGQEIHRFGGFFLTGCGHPVGAALLNASRILVFLLPLTYAAVWANSLNGIFYARLTADVGSGILALICAKILTRNLLARNSADSKAATSPLLPASPTAE